MFPKNIIEAVKMKKAVLVISLLSILTTGIVSISAGEIDLDKKIPPGSEEKDTLITQKSMLALAAKIKSVNKITEIGKICSEINRLIESNPAQRAGLQRIAVPALSGKYNNLKKTVEQKLASVNLKPITLLKEELNKKREAALKEIREGKTAGEGSHPKTSSKMDSKVKEVRAMWEKPLERLVQLDNSLDELVESMIFLATELEKYNTTVEKTLYDLDIILALTTESKIDIKNFPLNGTEAKLIMYNKKIMEENKTNKTATASEKETVRLQNEYCIMMGLNALRIDDRLTNAARKHSGFMKSTKQFAHSGIGDGDFSSRARAEGYQGSAGENIFMGSGALRFPNTAFTWWYWSHGHHLNMLGDWESIAAGNAGGYFTTMFGQ